MDHQEYKQMLDVTPLTTVRASDWGPANRTLLYGYTVDRHDWHVYYKDGLIHVAVASLDVVEQHWSRAEWTASALVPNKRVYPESTDAGFARFLRSMGVRIPFTLFDDARYERVKNRAYHGPIEA